jgi:peptidyl-tRNA hydrolase
MIFLMRMDLKLGLGKMASQIANATLAAYKLMDIKK